MFGDDNNDSGDIDALNSILFWEDDDENAVASSVEATNNALAQREHPMQQQLPQQVPGFQYPNWTMPYGQYFPDMSTMPTLQHSSGLQGGLLNPSPVVQTPRRSHPAPPTAPTLTHQHGASMLGAQCTQAATLPPALFSKGKPIVSSDEGAKGKNVSTEDKAKANRDRNREHARNTRLRKKQYLETLKKSLTELGKERDLLVNDRAVAATLMAETTKIRTEVLLSFLALRSEYKINRELWSRVLDESGFQCVLPVTPYRSFRCSEVQVSKCQRMILGIDGMIADTASMHVMMSSIVDRKVAPDGEIKFRYTLVTEESVIAGHQIMARWQLTTLNAVQCGARCEVSKKGMLCVKFNSAHRIVALELMFDVMAFMLQLKQSTGKNLFSVIPNTVQTCNRVFDEPMVLTLSERPYTIVQVNSKWEEMTGYKADEVIGKKSCRILQGPNTDLDKVAKLMLNVRFKLPDTAKLLNYTKDGNMFWNYLYLYPQSTDSKITHYLGLSSHFEPIQIDPE